MIYSGGDLAYSLRVCDALPDEREAVVSDRTMSSADSVLEDIQTAIEDPTEIHDFLVGERGAP
jgi:hypothetical protein